MSFEAWGTPPDREPKYCPVCDQESHSTDCELGKMQSRAFRAEDEIAELKRQLEEYAAEESDMRAAGFENAQDLFTSYVGIKQKLAESKAREVKFIKFISEVAKQTPEKPDYWSSCSQCERNSSEAEDFIALPHDDTALKEYRNAVITQFVGEFKRHVGGDGEFWLHELEDYLDNLKGAADQ